MTEGITYFDHPANPRYPTHWHVRDDGWMGASLCMQEPLTITRDDPLRLRYLLYIHRDAVNPIRADEVAGQFEDRSAFEIRPATAPHRQFELSRSSADDSSG